MKNSLVLLALLLCGKLLAQPLVIFSKTEAFDLKSPATLPSDSAKAAFIQKAKAAFAAPVYDRQLPLINPPEWGKTVSAETCGDLRHLSSFESGFVCHLSLDHLAPNHRYILTLNGNPKLKGNDLLVDPVPGLPEERFYDFLFITTDAKGHYDSDLAVALTHGAYEVRMYVKDTDDFKIVLYHDYFPFTVK